MTDDVVLQDFNCPRCGAKLKEKRPQDSRLVRHQNKTVRLFCPCGYYRDELVNPKDFKSS
jgi:transcription initiation factor IIE alpha subunit